MMASRSSMRSKPGLSLIEDEYWYAGSLSERKAEIILTKLGEPGCFLVRDSLLPEADYVLSVNSGKDIWHYDIQILPSNECIFNKYTFTSLPDAVMFYTENRLGSVFLKEPEEPVVSEAQLKSVGPSVIKAAAPGAIKPPRTSPFVSTESTTNMTTITATVAVTSSPRTRRLVAPESLKRPPSPRTPPATSARIHHHHHTSSPQTRKLTAPESIKPPHRMQFVSMDTHANASPQFQHREPQPPPPQPPDKEVVSGDTANRITLSALPRTGGLVGGDGWLETHSGAGSQVSLGSHSPKPQSVHHFVVDLEESAGTSQISSQTSEVDCSYIAPSKEAESVFVTSGYMYVAPPAPEFDSTSTNGEDKNDEQTLIQNKGKDDPKGERGEGGNMKAEICETQFDSRRDPTTAILDTPSSAESTPVRHVYSLATTEHITHEQENTHEDHGLPNNGSPIPPTKEVSKENEERRKSNNGSSDPDGINELPSIASRKLAFEQQARTSKENDRNATSKPAKKPPTVPKRVSSIPTLYKEENGQRGGGDQNATNPDKLAVVSSDPLQEESKVPSIEAEELVMPPPPPMSTHPGITAKKPAAMPAEPVHSEHVQQGEQEEEESVKELEKPKPEIVEQEQQQEEEHESARELEKPDLPKEELQDSSKLRPVPKERHISVLAVKSKEPETEQLDSSSTEPPEDVKNAAPVIEPSTEMSSMSNGMPTAPPQDETDGIDIEETNASTFGHTASPTKSDLPAMAITSEQSPGEERRTSLDDIDPSKKIGAEVSTFKPIPKPRSTHHLSAAFDNSTVATATSISKDNEVPRPPKLHLRTHNIAIPRSPPPTYTPEMKRSSAFYPMANPANREFLLRAQSMSILPTTGSASPRMVARGEQRQQMPPGFMVFSRSQEAVVSHGRHATLTSNMMKRTIQVNKKGDGEQTGSAATAPLAPIAAPMNTKRLGGPTKKRRSLFRRK